MNKNKPLGIKLKELREKAGKTRKESYEHIGMAQSTFSNMEAGRKEPSAQEAIELCLFYGCRNILEALGYQTEKHDLNNQEIELMENFKRLDYYDKDTVLDIVKRMANKPEEVVTYYYTLPVYDQSASAGTGTFLDSDHYELVEFSDIEVPPGTTFGVRISGDSMEPDFPNHAIAFVHHTKLIEKGDIGVFILNNEAYIKRLGETGLESINPDYSTIEIREYDDLRVVGRVLGYVEK